MTAVSRQDLSPDVEITAAEAQAAYALEERIRKTISKQRDAWVDLAGDLYTFQTTHAYRQLGYEGFEEWLASPDIDIKRRWVYELLSIWKHVVVDAGVPPEKLRTLEPSKVQDVMVAIRRRHVDPDRALADAAALSRNDLRQLYAGQGDSTTPTPTGAAPDDTPHYDAESEPQWVRCPTCNSRVREDQLQ